MSDMLVKLYALPERAQDTDKDYEIIRPMAPDKFRVVEWVKEHSGTNSFAYYPRSSQTEESKKSR